MRTPPAAISREGFDELFQKVSNWRLWGNDDERGTLNYITPECVRAAASLVRSGSTVSMAVPINKVAGPDNPHPVSHYMSMTFDGDSALGEPGFSLDFMAGERFTATAIPTLTRSATWLTGEGCTTASQHQRSQRADRAFRT
jgi:hypothetical protein